jgi:hypothetical protein
LPVATRPVRDRHLKEPMGVPRKSIWRQRMPHGAFPTDTSVNQSQVAAALTTSFQQTVQPQMATTGSSGIKLYCIEEGVDAYTLQRVRMGGGRYGNATTTTGASAGRSSSTATTATPSSVSSARTAGSACGSCGTPASTWGTARSTTPATRSPRRRLAPGRSPPAATARRSRFTTPTASAGRSRRRRRAPRSTALRRSTSR